MKIFCQKPSSWESKVNFVDENNVLLGYDNEDSCCASGGWFLADKADEWLEETFKEEPMELQGWVFDKTYFKEWELPSEYDSKETYGGAAQFRLVNGDKEKFLTLYNHQNGYYSRGFELKESETKVREGSV